MRQTEIKVSVPRTKLIEALKKQLDEHRKEHAVAMADWRKVMQRGAKEVLDKGAELKSTPSSLCRAMRPPQSYEDSFLTSIRMLEMSEDPAVLLHYDDYQTLVEGQWAWKSEFTSTNSFYGKLSSGGPGAEG